MVLRILAMKSRWETFSDSELIAQARSFQWAVRSGGSLEKIAVETFSLAAEAISRSLGVNLYPVQIYGGLLLQQGRIAEMQTGEGKTITAVAPVSLRAFAGRGCHVMTANEYLAQRDVDKLRPAYELLGLSVGCVTSGMAPSERKAAYLRDITYGTASEFGFDYLRDRLAHNGTGTDVNEYDYDLSSGATVQRGHYFVLIDEADSILLDEGRTPLIISLPAPTDFGLTELMIWARDTARSLEAGKNFAIDPKTRAVHLTEAGCRRVLLSSRPPEVCRFNLETVYTRIETALQADWVYQCDRDYLIHHGEVQIVDESTGRSLEGRRWQRGLHQAVELKEGLSPSEDQGVAARITLQRFLRLYSHVSGMTGTAWTARREFQNLYGCQVRRVPTHRPGQRRNWPPRVFLSRSAKWDAVADTVVRLREAGRAVLIGTPSIQASDELSERLQLRGIAHGLLNARQDAEEAHIISCAGQRQQVTIATNMAGRGTDIELSPEVRQAGGLHVMMTEMHSSPRIDRQLVGRAARQGDPGSFQVMVSLEDELLNHVSFLQRQRWLQRASKAKTVELSARHWMPVFYRVQRDLERGHARDRRRLLRAEQERWKTLRQIGLDPTLDLAEDQ